MTSVKGTGEEMNMEAGLHPFLLCFFNVDMGIWTGLGRPRIETGDGCL